MQTTLKYRLRPTREQKRQIARFMRGSAHAYNFGVDWMSDKQWSSKKELGLLLDQSRKEFKEQIEIRPELAEFRTIKGKRKALANDVITQSFKDLYLAYVNWRNPNMTSRRPSFKRINGRKASIRCQLDNRRTPTLTDKGIKFTNIGVIPAVQHRHLEGASAPKMATITRNALGEYHVCLPITIPDKQPRTTGATVGIDLGIACRMAFDNGEFINVENIFQIHASQIAKLQRKQSRCRNPSGQLAGSREFYRIQRQINRVYNKIANKRDNIAHQIIARLVASNVMLVCLETLDIAAMLKRSSNRARAKLGKKKYLHTKAVNLADASLGRLAEMLIYKCEKHGIAVQQIDQFYPSTQICSGCGVKHHMPTSKRQMECDCGVNIDRDKNAAINIKNEGINLFNKGRGNAVSTCRAGKTSPARNLAWSGVISDLSDFIKHGSDNKLLSTGSR